MSAGSLIPGEVQRQLRSMANTRLELIMVEAEEVREQGQYLLSLALGLLVFAVLAGLSLTTALVWGLWSLGPVLVLTATGLVWLVTCVILYICLTRGLRHWRPFAASFEQLRKDRAFVKEQLP